MVIGTAGYRVQFALVRFQLLHSTAVDVFCKLPFRRDGSHIVQLIQPVVFLVAAFNVDIDRTVGQGFCQIEILVLQHTLLEQQEKPGVCAAKSQLIIAIQNIENAGRSWRRFVHIVFAHRRGADSFERHVHTVHSGGVGYHRQEAWYQIDTIFICAYAQDGLAVGRTAKSLIANQCGIHNQGKLLKPIGVGGVIPVHQHIAEVDAVEISDVFCGGYGEHFEVPACGTVALGGVTYEIGQSHH